MFDGAQGDVAPVGEQGSECLGYSAVMGMCAASGVRQMLTSRDRIARSRSKVLYGRRLCPCRILLVPLVG